MRPGDLETLYDRYQQRLMHVDLKAFLFLQIFLSTVYIVLLLAFGVLPDIVGQRVLFLIACVFYSVAFTEEPFNKHKHLHGSRVNGRLPDTS